jgi:L-alanine-DL-glutamate epimerase-like enolase superfamily enzyme
MVSLSVRRESWPIRGSFAISRGSSTTAQVVVAELTDQADGGAPLIGRGESVPYDRYDETVDGVVAILEGLGDQITHGLDRLGLQKALPAGAARNALDCAFWDLEAKRAGHRVWQLLGLSPPQPLLTAYTLSLGTAEAMGKAAAENADRPLLKIKLSGPGDLERVEAIRQNAPRARLIVDANEAWTLADFVELAPRLQVLGVELIEQPLPADQDEALAGLHRPIPVCADESCHDTATLAHIEGRYDAINIKLEKTGGLTEALRLKKAALAQGYEIMVGCMIGTSLAMAPAILVAQGAKVVDLDAPLLLARDRPEGLRYDGSLVHPSEPDLWG